MSKLFEQDAGCILSHSDFINKVYEKSFRSSLKTFHTFKIRDDLFDITKPFKSPHNIIETCEINYNTKKRKRKLINISQLSSESQYVKDVFENIVNLAKCKKVISEDLNKDNNDVDNNQEARQCAEHCLSQSLCLRGLDACSGGNNTSFALHQSLQFCDILLPAKSRFFCGDVRNIIPKLNGEQFDIIILDPPWWNKYIRRSKAKKPENSYEMMYNSEVANLDLDSLLAPGGVIAVWCTNSLTHENDVKETMFKNWNVEYKATWYWMKVTKYGLPLCPFTESTGKKPYERIIIGRKINIDGPKEFPEKYVIVSVPSALHSHKPPLNDLLSPFVATADPVFLEIFARYLLPNTVSVGLEPLRFQHSQLYTKIS